MWHHNRAPRWTFTDPCKSKVRPDARVESASPAWLAAPAMNARNTTKVFIWRIDTGKGIITLESNPTRETVLPDPRGKGNKCDKNQKYKRTDAPSLSHQQCSITVDINGSLQTKSETKCLGGVSVSCLASRTRHECPRHNESVYIEAWHWM